MEIVPVLLNEFEHEAAVTRKFLERVPAENLDWKPHEKSMTLMQLTTHLAELPGWVAMGLHTSELDFAANEYKPIVVASTEELLDVFDKAYESGRAALSAATEDDMLPEWTLRSGDHIHMKMNKYGVIRHSLNQTTHHRAQLGVFLRLLNVPIPGTYGPSADEPGF